MCTSQMLDLLHKYGIDPNNLPPGWDDRIHLPTEPPPTPAQPPQREGFPEGSDYWNRPSAPAQPPKLFQAEAPKTAAELNANAADSAAPQSLGGVAARFSVPVGKHGYSKSLRPEAGRLVR